MAVNISQIAEMDSGLISEATKIRYYPFVAATGDGTRLTDVEGKEYIDFTGSWALANTGYSHPVVKQHIVDQLNRTTFASLVSGMHETALNLAERLTEIVPGDFHKKVWFGLSGSDASETLARLLPFATGKRRIVTFVGGWHGQSSIGMELSGHISFSHHTRGGYVTRVPYPNPYRPPFPDAPDLAEACVNYIENYIFELLFPPDEVAAIYVEAVQSDGGDIVPPPNFLPLLEQLCRRHDIFLAVDEVKVGMGRTGEWFGFQHSGVTPDAVVLGKSLGGGLPLSAVVARAEILDAATGAALFTSSGNANSCAAGVGVVEAIKQDGLVENAGKVGAYMNKKLKELQGKHEMIGDVRGLGMINGVELVRDRETKEPASTEAAKVVYRAYELGLLVFYVGTANVRVLEITPPLVMTEADVDEGVAILDQAISDVEQGKVSDEKVAAYAGW